MTDRPAKMDDARTEPRKSERDLFLEALERPTPGERAAFLDEVCADDPPLRVAVEALLRNHKEDDFLELPVLAAPSAARSADGGTKVVEVVGERPGDRVGR